MNQREQKILNAIYRGDDDTTIIMSYMIDSDELQNYKNKLKAILDSSKPAPVYQLDCENCNILFHGREINWCAEMHKDEPSDKNWLDVEKACLLCLLYQNDHDVKSRDFALYLDVAGYFGRTPSALAQKAWHIISKERKPAYLPDHIWEHFKK
jgi:hypothetical protein